MVLLRLDEAAIADLLLWWQCRHCTSCLLRHNILYNKFAC